MTDDKNTSLIQSGSNGLVRVGNSIEITNKIISEHEERLLQGLYPTVKIGNQQWMSKNLDVDCYANGDPIPQVQNPKEWENLKTGAWCYYNNDPLNGKIYGKLYNWYAVNDPRGLAPKGWKIPSDEDWTILTDYLGGKDVAGTKMKSTGGWEDNGNGTNGSNESGFLGLPGGYRNKSGGYYSVGLSILCSGHWWSSTQDDTGSILYRALLDGRVNVIRYNDDKVNGKSVRCLRD